MTDTLTRDPHLIRLWIATYVGHEGQRRELYYRDMRTGHTPAFADRVRLFSGDNDQMSQVRSRYWDATGLLHITLTPIVSEPDDTHRADLGRHTALPGPIGWWTPTDGDIDRLLPDHGWTPYDPR